MSDNVPHVIILQVSARICEQRFDGGYSPENKSNLNKIIVLETKNLKDAEKLLEKKIEELKIPS